MSYYKRFDKFNETLMRVIMKLEEESENENLVSILKSVYMRTSDRDDIYHAAWISLFNETHRVIEKGCIHNKKAAKVVRRIMNDIEEEMLYGQDGD